MGGRKAKRRKNGFLTFCKAVCILLLVIAAAGAVVLLFATIAEYRPADREAAELETAAEGHEPLHEGDTMRVVTWNIGYGALGDNADFFMDGGKMVNTADVQRVEENISGMIGGIKDMDADIVLLQEVDRDSARSHHIPETARFREALPEYPDSSFAWNFKTSFVPYPVPPIGKVGSGLLTLSAPQILDAERVQLPCPFSWPVRTVNLKRCVVINRIPIEDSEKELVVMNLHLEAYDSGEGKVEQTRMLRELLETERAAGNYVIAGGDFNQIFSDVDASAYPVYEGKWQPGVIEAADFSDEWQLLMDSRVPTCRSLDQPYAGADLSQFQYYVIDGFIMSDNIEVLSLETRDQGFVSTDHNPVLAEVRLIK